MDRLGENSPPSRQQVVDDSSMHIGQAIVTTGVAVGQPCVIDSQQVQNGRMKIVHMDTILGDRGPDFICGTVDVTTFDTAASHPG